MSRVRVPRRLRKSALTAEQVFEALDSLLDEPVTLLLGCTTGDESRSTVAGFAGVLRIRETAPCPPRWMQLGDTSDDARLYVIGERDVGQGWLLVDPARLISAHAGHSRGETELSLLLVQDGFWSWIGLLGEGDD